MKISNNKIILILFLLVNTLLYAQDSSLLIHYNFDESTITQVPDISGNANHATVFGNPSLVDGKSGKALSFGTYTDYLQLPNNLCSKLQSFTVASWVKMNSLANWSRIFDFGNGTNVYMFLSPYSGANNFRFGIKSSNSSEFQINSSDALKTGVWTHIAVTFSWNAASSVAEGKVFVDGVLKGVNSSISVNPTSFRNSYQNYIAKSQFTSDPALFGDIDDFRVYNRALSADEVLALTGISEELMTAFKNLQLDLNPDAVTENILLPLSQDGIPISWSSNFPDIISNSGVVIRPKLYDNQVILTAKLSHTVNGVETSVYKDFILKVLASEPNPTHWESMVLESDTWKYLPATSEPSNLWLQPSFDDSSWSSGAGGIGFADGDDKTVIGACNSLYLRKQITVPDISKIEDLVLDIDYDDAFVLYINGIERARSTNITTAIPAYNAALTTDHEAKMYSGGSPERFFLKSSFLQSGVNTIAVHILNIGLSSTDLSSRVFLQAKVLSQDTLFHPTPSWFIEPVSFQSSNLPIIQINTNGQTIVQNSKITAKMKVLNNLNTVNYLTDTLYEFNGNVGIEIRGFTSSGFPKKSYSLETRDSIGNNLNVALLGLPKENDWVFHGPYSDKSLVRNVLAYNLGNKTGKWSPRTRFFELYLNDVYNGIYVLVEKIKIDKNRLKIATLNSVDTLGDQVTGGYIMKIDRPEADDVENVDYWWSKYRAWTNLQQRVPFIFHDPKGSELHPAQIAYLRDYVSRFEDAMYSDNYKDRATGFYPFVNLQSFVDYYIITELSRNLDGYRISTFFYKDKDSKEGKLTMGPFWDYNICFGNADFFSAGNTAGWVIDGMGDADAYAMPFWWEKMRLDPYFNSHLKKRWNVLKDSVINPMYINNLIDSCAYDLREAVNRNFTTWNVLNTYVWPNKYVGGTYANELAYLKSWVRDRILWMDSQIQPIEDITVDVVAPENFPMDIVSYPNPFTDNLNFKFYLENSSEFELQIFDLMGRQVYKTNQKFSSGLQNLTVEVDKFNSNSKLFIYRVLVNDHIKKTGKLIRN